MANLLKTIIENGRGEIKRLEMFNDQEVFLMKTKWQLWFDDD